MLILAVAAPVLGTNAYLLSTGPHAPCVVVDPGIGVLGDLASAIEEHDLEPRAVVLTHGHLDHTYSAAALVDRFDVPVLVHPADRDQLQDPFTALGPQLGPMIHAQFGPAAGWRAPDRVADLEPGDTLSLAGLDLTVRHAPGHTPGSVLLGVRESAHDPADAPVLLSGDVLFAGSIGRTDLPGGDDVQMRETLRSEVLTLPPGTRVLPGHGAETTIDAERATNPYLGDLT